MLQKIKMAKTEHENLLKMQTKTKNEFLTKKAKIEEEKNQIIDLFAEFVFQKNIQFDISRAKRSTSATASRGVSRETSSRGIAQADRSLSKNKSTKSTKTLVLQSNSTSRSRLSEVNKSQSEIALGGKEKNFLQLFSDSHQASLPSNLRALSYALKLEA